MASISSLPSSAWPDGFECLAVGGVGHRQGNDTGFACCLQIRHTQCHATCRQACDQSRAAVAEAFSTATGTYDDAVPGPGPSICKTLPFLARAADDGNGDWSSGFDHRLRLSSKRPQTRFANSRARAVIATSSSVRSCLSFINTLPPAIVVVTMPDWNPKMMCSSTFSTVDRGGRPVVHKDQVCRGTGRDASHWSSRKIHAGQCGVVVNGHLGNLIAAQFAADREPSPCGGSRRPSTHPTYHATGHRFPGKHVLLPA